MGFANALIGLMASEESWIEQLIPDDIQGTVLIIIIVAAIVIVLGLVLFFILKGYFAEVKKIDAAQKAQKKDSKKK